MTEEAEAKNSTLEVVTNWIAYNANRGRQIRGALGKVK
jgi:hypothetical protein